MVGFLILPTIKTAVLTNLFLNGFIVCVFVFGILYCFLQVLRLYPEIRWINDFRISDPGEGARRGAGGARDAVRS